MSMKVLIADPDWRFAQQASSFLEAHAHLVVQAPQARQVMDTVRQWQPDLVIVAEELTEGSLLQELHAIKGRPAVLLVGWMDRYDRTWRAWQKGGDELLMKPIFRRDELHAGIVAAMENRTAGVRNRAVAASA